MQPSIALKANRRPAGLFFGYAVRVRPSITHGTSTHGTSTHGTSTHGTSTHGTR